MSLPHTILNEEYRDMTVKSVYPFLDSATLTNGYLAISERTFIDILIYVSGDFTAPFYISALNGLAGTDDEAQLVISDYNGNEVGFAMLDKNKDTCYIKQGGSIQAGVIVYNKDEMIKLLGELGRSRMVFTSGQTALAAGQCFCMKPGNTLAVAGDDKSWTGDVEILADGGVTFDTRIDSESGDTVVSVNLYGESVVHPNAILSINGIVFPEGHVWLAAHPDSNLRVLTTVEDIEVINKKDIDYGN